MKRLSHINHSSNSSSSCCRLKCVPTLLSLIIILFGLFSFEPCQSRPIRIDHGSRDQTSSMLATAQAAIVDQQSIIETRMAGTINEVEWLLHQLVDILTDMVNGIDNEPTLLHNHNFRLILIQVIKRIDYVLEHFEKVGTTILTPSVNHELARIDCIRIRLINYLSQSRRFDDSKCMKHAHETVTTTVKPSPSHDGHNDQILPILTQIVAILVRISDQLHVLEKEIHQAHHHHHHGANGGTSGTTTTTVSPSTAGWNNRPTVDWDRLFSQMSQTTQGPMSQTTSGIDWDSIFAQNSGTQVSSINAGGSVGGGGQQEESQKTTDNWPDLISQVSQSISSITTTTPSTTGSNGSNSVTNTNNSENWEDIMNQLINQWNENQTTPHS